jgi:BirA family biotin operon repressor/biotin-[acetyl-CoA-carboxylase] ligase
LKELNKKAILKDLKENDIDIRIFSSIDSTNDECKRQCFDKKYLLITAEEQTKGRGRSGKNWISQKLGNVYMSFAFNNNLKNSPISLITGVIVHSILAKITQSKGFGLKWPNDILLKNKKIGGILVENEIQGNKIKTIIGIGINFNLEERESWWGDLSEFSKIIERNNLINGITKNLIDYIENENLHWIDSWHHACSHLNKKVKVISGSKTICEGIFIGINDDGSMNIKLDDKIENFKFGEVSIKGIY